MDSVELVQREVEIAVFEIFERHFPKGAKFRSSKLHFLVVDAARRAMVRQALRCTGGEQSRAAARLGINRNTLNTYMRKLGLPTYYQLPLEERHEFGGRGVEYTGRGVYRSR